MRAGFDRHRLPGPLRLLDHLSPVGQRHVHNVQPAPGPRSQEQRPLDRLKFGGRRTRLGPCPAVGAALGLQPLGVVLRDPVTFRVHPEEQA